MEAGYEGYSGKNKYSPHDKGSNDAPEQYLVLILIFNSKIREYKYKYENIVNTKRVFNYIPCKEFKGFGFSKFEENKQIKYHCKTDPDNTPDNSLFNRNFMCVFMKNTQIQSKHQKNENMKSYPEVDANSHNNWLSGCKLMKLIP